jgi:hypothetical protein
MSRRINTARCSPVYLTRAFTSSASASLKFTRTGLSRINEGSTYMSIPLGCKKSPVFLDRGKGAAICATGGERVGYLLHFLKAPRIRVERNSATLKPEERPVVRSTNAAFAHDLCMEHFSSALSGVSTNCALSGTQRHTPLDSGDESAEQITPYRYLLLERPSCNRNYTRDNREQQNFPECVLPPSEFAHLPNLTKREICVGNNSHAAAFCAPGNACFAGPRLALQLRQIGTTSNGRS